MIQLAPHRTAYSASYPRLVAYRRVEPVTRAVTPPDLAQRPVATTPAVEARASETEATCEEYERWDGLA